MPPAQRRLVDFRRFAHQALGVGIFDWAIENEYAKDNPASSIKPKAFGSSPVEHFPSLSLTLPRYFRTPGISRSRSVSQARLATSLLHHPLAHQMSL